MLILGYSEQYKQRDSCLTFCAYTYIHNYWMNLQHMRNSLAIPWLSSMFCRLHQIMPAGQTSTCSTQIIAVYLKLAVTAAHYHCSDCMQLRAHLSTQYTYDCKCTALTDKLTQVLQCRAEPDNLSLYRGRSPLLCNKMAFPLPLPSGQFCFLVMSIRAHYWSLEFLLFHFRIPHCSPVLPWNLIFWSCGDFFKWPLKYRL